MQIQHRQAHCEGEFFLLDEMGNKAAQLTYFFIDERTINANHTYVSPTLRGQGMAEQLYQALVRFVEQNQLHFIPTCSYIVKKWQRDNQ